MDDGRVFAYDVEDEGKVREHSFAIIKDGYRRHTGNGVWEYYPPHRISKVKSHELPVSVHTDSIRGTE